MEQLTKAKQADFDRRFLAAYAEYAANFTRPAFSAAELKRILKKHQLVRNGKLISHKQFSTLLIRHRLLSRDAWRNQITDDLFDTLLKAGMKKTRIIRILADTLHISYSKALRKIRKHGLVAKLRSKKN
ncbi:hypothetical protein L4D76_12140 [Photobacterium sagamiensis]|uniref:hypothetical protein n=1 Tax=Photobacterium sagamiensis TaxID=2910241 RepID=UPI003D115F9D